MTLYIVATPIGNLSDFTQRAEETLKRVHCILAEDTRVTKRLADAYGIVTRLVAMHQHNERETTEKVLGWLAEGKEVALVSDAGTPLISDPGHRCVKAVREAGYPVVPIPGPSACIAALSASSLSAERFAFEGFLPSTGSARVKALKSLVSEPRTLVFYESSHRLMKMLADLRVVFQDRPMALAKELTKQFEAIVEGSAQEVMQWVSEDPARQKGEFVVLVEGAPDLSYSDLILETQMQKVLKFCSTKDAAALMSELTGVSKRTLYELALRLAKK